MNRTLNVIKCISAFFVICIHCTLQYSGKIGIAIDGIIRVAVPIFFLISGYYSYFEDNEVAKKKYKKRIKNLIKLIILSSILYFIINIINLNSAQEILEYLKNKFTARNIFTYIVLNASPFQGHLWFLNALLYCYIICYFMNKYDIKLNKLYKYIPILITVTIMFGEVASHMKVNITNIYYRNVWFYGLPYFLIGCLINEKGNKIKELITNKELYFYMLLGTILVIIERFATAKLDMYIGTIITSISIFIWCVKNPNLLNIKPLEWIGGKIYTHIYILHYMVINIVNSYEKSIGINIELRGSNIYYLNAIVVFLITVILSIVIYNFVNITKKICQKREIVNRS